MKRITLKDIAQSLDVTVGTVSHVLNGINDISEETKKRVLEKARELGYIRNSSAVSLRSGKTNTIAVIIPDISNPHIAYQIKLIENCMKQYNYSVIILNTNEDEETEYHAIQTAYSQRVDGILLCPTQKSTQNIDFLNKLGIKFILIGRFFDELDTDYICADDFKGGYLAGKYLIEKNCKIPLYIGTLDCVQGSINRYNGLCQALSDNNISVSDICTVKVNPNEPEISDVLNHILKHSNSFDSIVVFSDLISFKILSALKMHGIEREVPVISFDAICTHLFLPFYNVSIGMKGNGWAECASKALIDKINSSTTKCQKLIDVELHIYYA